MFVTAYGCGRIFRPENSASRTFRRGRFGVDVSASTFRLRCFGVDVSASSAQTFRRANFGAIVWAPSHFHVRERYIVPLGKDRTSLCRGHNVLLREDTLSSMERTHCPAWERHIILFGTHTMSSVETRQFLDIHCGIIMKAFLLRDF